MRYVEVTTKYVVPVPQDQESGLEMVMNTAVTAMEKFMKERASAITEVRSDWAILPREYVPSETYQGNGDQDVDDPVPTITPALMPTRADFERLADRNRDREMSKFEIEHDLDRGISFASEVMHQEPPKIPHPWDEGLRVLPLDHPFAAAETEALRAEGMLCPDSQCDLVRGHPGEHALSTTVLDDEGLERARREITSGR